MIDYMSWVAQAEARLAEIEQERERLLSIIENARALAPLAQGGAVITTRVSEPRQARSTRVTGRVSKIDATREAVREILEEKREPLETRELVPLVKAKGVMIGGQDDVATLSARLSNSSDHFTLHRGHGWWFVDRPLPGAFADFEEAEGHAVPAQPPASNQETEGGESDTAAIDEQTS